MMATATVLHGSRASAKQSVRRGHARHSCVARQRMTLPMGGKGLRRIDSEGSLLQVRCTAPALRLRRRAFIAGSPPQASLQATMPATLRWHTRFAYKQEQRACSPQVNSLHKAAGSSYRRHRGLTPRSRRGPTASRQARLRVRVIIPPPGLASYRRSRLNSNVRRRNGRHVARQQSQRLAA